MMRKRSVKIMADKILGVLKAICQSTTPGKKMVQKLMYLIERKGIDLGLDYRIHFYGPYSSDLDHFLRFYESENILEIDTTGVTHKIKMISNLNENYLSTHEEKVVKDIIEKYSHRSPLELEALTTTDFVACELMEDNELSIDNIICNVKRIKGSKFSKQEILECINDLKENGFIN